MIKVFSSALRDPTTGAARPVTIEVHGQALLVRLGQAMPKGEDAPHHATADFTAQRAEIVAALDEREAERTPETVLRAMLRAYERAAFDAERARYRTPDTRSDKRAKLLHRQCEVIRREAAGVAEDFPDPVDFRSPGEPFADSAALTRDYQARLAGTRPLDAAPLGEEVVPS